MKLHEDGADLPDKPCCSLDATSDARRVCEQLGVPHYVLNLVDVFRRDVFDDFVREYAAGRTPIPCVRCNTFTKFRDLVDKADAIDAQWIATGHYGRLAETPHGPRCCAAATRPRTRATSCGGCRASVLGRLLLPVGDWTKDETRAAARRFGLRTADKPESMDICFVPDGDHVEILREQLPADAAALSPGPIVTEDGRVIGEHDGLRALHHRAAQGTAGRLRRAVVRDGDPRRHARGGGGAARRARAQRGARRADELAGARRRPRVTSCRCRCATAARTCRPRWCAPMRTTSRWCSPKPVHGIAPGQSLVLYDGDVVLGGGVITRAGRGALPLLVRSA